MSLTLSLGQCFFHGLWQLVLPTLHLVKIDRIGDMQAEQNIPGFPFCILLCAFKSLTTGLQSILKASLAYICPLEWMVC
ncbi:hypothetical protein F5878DRAFT_634327 [Lentinula raphanica]|uniref:Uncharacterized protein n=1 Tax=Lentinula raphanica TaxID=153919 RepID=A0AA38U5V7_9AGAR|nr:hypothetical protein F5878DRAFT_634327 [Lentinula raphanica]